MQPQELFLAPAKHVRGIILVALVEQIHHLHVLDAAVGEPVLAANVKPRLAKQDIISTSTDVHHVQRSGTLIKFLLRQYLAVNGFKHVLGIIPVVLAGQILHLHVLDAARQHILVLVTLDIMYLGLGHHVHVFQILLL